MIEQKRLQGLLPLHKNLKFVKVVVQLCRRTLYFAPIVMDTDLIVRRKW